MLVSCLRLNTQCNFSTAQAYNADIYDLEQPLLVSQPKKREIRARGEDAGPILLIPELCTRTGEEGVKEKAQGVSHTVCTFTTDDTHCK